MAGQKDLLDQLGSKTETTVVSDGAQNTQDTKQVEPVSNTEQPVTAATEQVNGDATAEAKEASTVKNPDDWSKDSALKEVTKLREENKAQRLKFAEKLEEIKTELDQKHAPLKNELEKYKAAQEELDRIKAQEEDKKRDLSEKVSHRDQRISELEAKIQAIETDSNKEVLTYKEKLSAYEAAEAARKQMYQDELDNELKTIPEKFREHADLIAKGAGDPSEGLVAIKEAKIKGFFEDKTVVVNHAVPGASDGARATKEQLDAAARAERDKMSPRDKVKAALSGIRSGESNSAFRNH